MNKSDPYINEHKNKHMTIERGRKQSKVRGWSEKFPTYQRVYKVAIRQIVTYRAETMILIKGQGRKTKEILEENCEENLRARENSGRSLPKTGELRGTGKISRG